MVQPNFREPLGATMNLGDVGLIFNTTVIGPTSFVGLRSADYGEGFRMPTMPELLHLVHASFENQGSKSAESIIRTLKGYWLMGNTGILYTEKGMYIQDNPSTQGEIIMDERTLECKLFSHDENGVAFSEDGSVRFAPHGFKRNLIDSSEISKNSGIIALVSGKENAEKLEEIYFKHFKLKPFFWTLGKMSTPETQTRIAGLDTRGRGDELCIVANYTLDVRRRYSFGVRETHEQ